MGSEEFYRFFIGEGPEAEELYTDVKKRTDARVAAQKELIEKYGADSLQVNGNDWSPRAFGYKDKNNVPRFMKPCGEEDGYYLFKPNLRYNLGRELGEEFADPKYAFSARDYVVCILKLSRMTFGSGHWYRTSVGWTDDHKLLVQIPVDVGDVKSSDPWPEIPSWLREVKYSEFLAAQGK